MSGTSDARKYAAELIGTFVLVFMGCGSVIIGDGYVGNIGNLGIAFAFGLSLLAMVYASAAFRDAT